MKGGGSRFPSTSFVARLEPNTRDSLGDPRLTDGKILLLTSAAFFGTKRVPFFQIEHCEHQYCEREARGAP